MVLSVCTILMLLKYSCSPRERSSAQGTEPSLGGAGSLVFSPPDRCKLCLLSAKPANIVIWNEFSF